MTVSFTEVAVFAALALASARVAYCITSDDIFLPLRARIVLADSLKHRGAGTYDGQGFLAALFSCPYCMSAWTSLAAAGAWYAVGNSVIYAATPLALWCLANILAVKGL